MTEPKLTDNVGVHPERFVLNDRGKSNQHLCADQSRATQVDSAFPFIFLS